MLIEHRGIIKEMKSLYNKSQEVRTHQERSEIQDKLLKLVTKAGTNPYITQNMRNKIVKLSDRIRDNIDQSPA